MEGMEVEMEDGPATVKSVVFWFSPREGKLMETFLCTEKRQFANTVHVLWRTVHLTHPYDAPHTIPSQQNTATFIAETPKVS